MLVDISLPEWLGGVSSLNRFHTPTQMRTLFDRRDYMSRRSKNLPGADGLLLSERNEKAIQIDFDSYFIAAIKRNIGRRVSSRISGCLSSISRVG